MAVRIAGVQMRLSDSPQVNADRVIAWVGKAKAQGVAIVAFPEGTLNYEEESVRELGDALERVKVAARAHKVSVIVGSYVRDGERVRNVLWAINEEGDVVLEYDKVHLYRSEKGKVVAGSENKVIALAGARVAVVNCWDYAFPEDLRALARAGAQIIFCPSYLMSHPRTREVLARVPQVRAFDTMSFFVFFDAVTEETFGKGKICHPLRELAAIEGEGMMWADVDVGELEELRSYFGNLA